MDQPEICHQAAEALRQARLLIVTAGAGMGVDSGLPDFRGDQGFWQAYPMYRHLGINFVDAANPQHFQRDPAFGWGFYGHRTNLYRATVPHPGFALLKQWGQRFDLDCFVVTSNVDGQFQKAGFAEEQMVEVHGSIHHLQCQGPCSPTLWTNRETIPIDEQSMRAEHFPRCPRCGDIARPNILMFGDSSWISDRSQAQEQRFQNFLAEHDDAPAVVIEIGAGSAIPTIRYLSERLGRRPRARVVRINPREPQIPAPHISLPCSALSGLEAINAALAGR